MAFNFLPIKGALRAALATGLLIATLAPALPALAASAHPFQSYRSDNAGPGNGAPFDIDQDPCRNRDGRHRGNGGGYGDVCDDNAGSSHGNVDQHHPGPSAFGLQFNSEGD